MNTTCTSKLSSEQLRVLYETSRLSSERGLTIEYLQRLGSLPLATRQDSRENLTELQEMQITTRLNRLPLLFCLRDLRPDEDESVLQLECINTQTGQYVDGSRLTICSFNYRTIESTTVLAGHRPKPFLVGEVGLGIDRLQAQANVGLSDPPPPELVEYRKHRLPN